MPDYLITWTINITADNPEQAARAALEIHRNPESTATVFDVLDTDTEDECEIDLDELDSKD